MAKLINMEKDEWRGKFKKEDTWRSTKAYGCDICGCKSNEWVLGGYPCVAPHLCCPTIEKRFSLHEKLREKIWKLEEEGHPKIYTVALKQEIKGLRKKFEVIKPNVKGIKGGKNK